MIRSTIGLGVVVGAVYLARSTWQRKIAEIADSGKSPYVGDVSSPFLWFDVSADNVITLHCPKVEMGQGTFTGLVQIAAEELMVRPDQMKIVHAESKSGNIDQFATGGSTSIMSLFQPLRELAATTRQMFINQAAKQMSMDPHTLFVEDGLVLGGSKDMTFGSIVAAAVSWDVPDTPELIPASQYKYIGKPIPRVDLRDKIIGVPMFGMDAEMPGMLYGAVVRPSDIGATRISVDASLAKDMPGVVAVVEEEDFVGVVARSYIEAENAKAKIEVEWDVPKVWNYKDITEKIKVGNGDSFTIQIEGDPDDLLGDPSVVRAEYYSPMGAHAQMEPNGAVASYVDGKVEIKMATQVVKITRDEVANRLGLSSDDVNIIPMYLGGGFGRRLHTPNAMHAAVMSKVVGAPVKCFLNRKEEFQHDSLRPPTHHVLKASLTSEGKIEAMEHNVASGDVMYGSPLVPRVAQTLAGSDIGAWRGGMIQYRAIPNYKAVSWRVRLPFATSWWRSLGLLANTFAIESFMDVLAERIGQDPIDFRLAHIQNDKAGTRLKAVIETCRDRAGYRNKAEGGRSMGFACSTDASTPCAHIAEVSLVDGHPKVHKVTCVIDPGMAVNPDQIKAQCEGAIIMGLSATMFEQMKVEDGQLSPTIYGPYKMALMKDAPKDIDVVILENDDVPGAVGEPPLGPIGAAIANATYRLSGTRYDRFPFVT